MKIKKTSGEYPLTIITSSGSVEFDEKGIAEVDEEAGELLLSIPGYEEVKTRGNGKKEGANVPPVDPPFEATGTDPDKASQSSADEDTSPVSDPADADSKKTTKAGK